MISKTILIAVLLAVLIFSLSMAEEDGAVLAYKNGETNRTLLLPRSIVRFEEVVRNAIDSKQMAEGFGEEVTAALYGGDGLLQRVLYTDDITVDYSYQSAPSGELISCELRSSRGITITFTREIPEPSPPPEEYFIVYEPSPAPEEYFIVYEPSTSPEEYFIVDEPSSSLQGGIVGDKPSTSPQEGVIGDKSSNPHTESNMGEGEKSFTGGREIEKNKTEENEIKKNEESQPSPSSTPKPEPITIIIEKPGADPIIYTAKKKLSLTDIAKKPIKFDFDRIGKAIDDTAATKSRAYYEYVKDTNSYYEKVYNELEAGVEKMKYDGIDISGYMKAAEDKDVAWKKKREAIDEAVAFIREAAKEGDAGRGTAGAFLVFEARYREDILDPSKVLYDKRIDEAVAYVNTLIDELVESKIGFYLAKKDLKIEAIVNLSQDHE